MKNKFILRNLIINYGIINYMKKIIFIISFIIFVSLCVYIDIKKVNFQNSINKQVIFDGRNSSFTIDEQKIILKNGLSEIKIAGSASKIITRYFGNEAYGDLNGDGLQDEAFLITQETGGSGIFYYVVVALKTTAGYKTINAFFIGDRIAPQTTQINSSAKELYVNFAERKPGEPMTAQPSQGATLYLKVTPAGVLEGLMN